MKVIVVFSCLHANNKTITKTRARTERDANEACWLLRRRPWRASIVGDYDCTAGWPKNSQSSEDLLPRGFKDATVLGSNLALLLALHSPWTVACVNVRQNTKGRNKVRDVGGGDSRALRLLFSCSLISTNSLRGLLKDERRSRCQPNRQQKHTPKYCFPVFLVSTGCTALSLKLSVLMTVAKNLQLRPVQLHPMLKL